MLDLVARLCLGVCLLYLLFWVFWFQLHRDCLHFLLRSKDKKYKSLDDPDMAQGADGPPRKKTIIFVRHGQSTWNITFNESKLPWLFVPRLLQSALTEFNLMRSGVRDSWFVDSPLSALGLAQADGLRAVLAGEAEAEPGAQAEAYRAIMRGDAKPSVLVTSNLRRSISTACVAFSDRVRQTEEQILLLPSCQEISTNPDTISITPPRAQPLPSWLERDDARYSLAHLYAKHLDPSQNTGSKAIDSNGLKRMLAFCDWAFNGGTRAEAVIVSGHSLWFRNFFREFLPRRTAHAAKACKIVNGGAVGFELECRTLQDGTHAYRVSPESIHVVHGGFKQGH